MFLRFLGRGLKSLGPLTWQVCSLSVQKLWTFAIFLAGKRVILKSCPSLVDTLWHIASGQTGTQTDKDTHPSDKNTHIGKVQREGNSEESETGLTENTLDINLNDASYYFDFVPYRLFLSFSRAVKICLRSRFIFIYETAMWKSFMSRYLSKDLR